MEEKKRLLKRSYYFPVEVLDAWEEFHAPSKDYSPSATGAFVAWMSLAPAVRDEIRKAAHARKTDVAVEMTAELIKQMVIETEINSALKSLSPAERKKLLATIKAG